MTSKKIFSLIFSLIAGLAGISQQLVVNPYEGINWKKINRYKANFHTHTNNSDGGFNAEYVVDTYQQNGYSILVLTDHNQVTYPWTNFSILNKKWENRNPQNIGILTFPGNELSRGGHDRNMFFAYIDGGGDNIDSAFQRVSDSSALSIFNHPGRYWKYNKVYSPGDRYSPEWYVNYFQKYNAVVGLEIYNTPYDRYPYDRVLWDEILTLSMPATPVWGYANDDMHGRKEMMGNYQFMLMPALTIEDLKTAMKNGNFIFSHEPGQSGKALAPQIESIQINTKRKKIKVIAENYQQIKWISGIAGADTTRTNNIVKTGEVFNWKGFDKPYVRFELVNDKGVTLSQPFGFKK